VVASALTAASRFGPVPLLSLAATPRAVAQGKVWLLLTSGVIADRPEVVSLLAFALVGLATLVICGWRMLWLTAVVGHVASTVFVYLALALIRLVAPTAFESVLSLPDYGVSAAIAAWIGAVAAIGWRRHPARAQRAVVIAGCVGATVIGWFCDPQLTVLDAEHIVAFGLGAALAVVPIRPTLVVRALASVRLVVSAARSLSASRRTRTENP
jgi:hypothetical protein